ncbi:MAG: hypothetical protein WAN65_14560 [Candidatus Sulfotelmatobacter sp.]
MRWFPMRTFPIPWFRLHTQVSERCSDTFDKDWINEKEHEEKSKTRVREFQERLDKLTGPTANAGDLEVLKDQVEIQLHIEDLILKSRMSEHVIWQAYGPFVIPLLAAILAAIAGYYFKRGC